MSDYIKSLSMLEFLALVLVIGTGLMIVLQTVLNKRVWSPYIFTFLCAVVVLLSGMR